uniref:Ubiquitin-conjugating enzyme E2 G2 n=1 Tax=Mus musculus TaxID=10090 RepID=Q3UWG7_MOUSE|nr:unnamed protein product [Mus musculus]
MAGTALKRLMAEYKQLTLNPPEGIVAGPMNEENFFEWEALIMGPEDTCFEFGVFPAILSFPLDYPLSPPKMRFTCEMFHPNIYPDGRVCISILHAPGDDPMGYESSAERWSPVQSVEKILLSVVSMLAEPNDESGANVDASKMWRDDREQFYKIAKQIVQKSLGPLRLPLCTLSTLLENLWRQRCHANTNTGSAEPQPPVVSSFPPKPGSSLDHDWDNDSCCAAKDSSCCVVCAPQGGPRLSSLPLSAMGSSPLLLPAVPRACPVVCQGLDTNAAPSWDMGPWKSSAGLLSLPLSSQVSQEAF